MGKFLLVTMLLAASLMAGGCIGESESFTCLDGSPLKLIDERWYCDSVKPVRPIPVGSDLTSQ